MAYEQKDNTGSLFRNDNRQSDNHPEYTGQGIIVCPHCGQQSGLWISAWVKTSKSLQKYFSFSFRPKDSAQVSPISEVHDDDLPF